MMKRWEGAFLDASTHLYKRHYPSIRQLVCWSVGLSVCWSVCSKWATVLHNAHMQQHAVVQFIWLFTASNIVSIIITVYLLYIYIYINIYIYIIYVCLFIHKDTLFLSNLLLLQEVWSIKLQYSILRARALWNWACHPHIKFCYLKSMQYRSIVCVEKRQLCCAYAAACCSIQFFGLFSITNILCSKIIA